VLSRSLLVRWALTTLGAAAWACAVWRLADGEGGPVEATFAVGGWGLGLLPVHVTMSPQQPGKDTRRYGRYRRNGRVQVYRQYRPVRWYERD